jgi:lipopolysaccharide transport system permease protein
MQQSTSTSKTVAPAASPASARSESEVASRTVRLQPTRGFSRVLSPRELWRYRDLAVQLIVRDVTLRYRQTALGAAWAILQPIAFMAIFAVFFGRLAGIPSNGLPYALFALAGLVPWMYFSNVLLVGAESLVQHTELVAKIYFPRIFMPLAVVGAGVIDLVVALAVTLTIILIYGIVPSAAILALPFIVIVVMAVGLGASAALAAVNVRYRDVRYVVPFAVQMWFFLTPIVYPSSILGQPWRTISAINPLVGAVEAFRWAVLDTSSAPWVLMGISFASAAVIVLGGLAYFDRVERSFADVI